MLCQFEGHYEGLILLSEEVKERRRGKKAQTHQPLTHELEMWTWKYIPWSDLDIPTAAIYQHKLLCLAAKLLSYKDSALPKLPTALFNNNLSF